MNQINLNDEERLQSLIAELRMVEAQLNVVNSQISIVANAIMDNRAALEALKSLPKDSNSEALTPIGGGVFVKANILPPTKLVVNVGANTTIEKTYDETISFIENRLKELEKVISTLEDQRISYAKRVEELRLLISKMVEEIQRRQG
ncbi:MAG: prefoldin subunit alpha [Nitrososphaerota archaeon]|nr:prefoldin subunit alpha [Nitrososphaerales archaeon]MDW8044632.1 prefoldin subunit alpha [Nitrososphaerota archaeon]